LKDANPFGIHLELANLLVSHAHDALIAISSTEGRVLLWNNAASVLFGVATEQALGHPIKDLITSPENWALLHAGLESCDEAGTDSTHNFKRADLTRMSVVMRCRRVKTSTGEAATLLALGAARGPVSTEFAEISDSYFRELLGAAPDAMVIASSDGSVRLVNAEFERLFGYESFELMGEPIEALMPERYREMHAKYRDNYFANPQPLQLGGAMLLYARRKDGTEFPAEVSLTPLQSEYALFVIATIRDISERVQTEQTLREAKDAAEAAGLAKTRFLANMSHEIRTPLTALLGFADLMLDPKLGESERLNYALTIRRNGEHLLSILNDILDVSMVEAGKLSVENIDFSLGKMLAEVASLIRVRAIEKGLAFRVEYETPIPSLLRSDPTRLRQILINIVSNAVKFTSQGDIRVLARCDANAHGALTLGVRVVDTGIGIAPEEMKHIFQPFSQADASMTRRFGGSGLGLAISALLAKALGGSLDVDSETQKGSIFTLKIPIESVEGSVTLSGPTEAIADNSLAFAPEAPHVRGRVLLAEDGPDNQRLISTLLSKQGIDVVVVENGLLAVHRALDAMRAGEPFDLILMDMQMPELDGYAATARLRAVGYQAPIVALTAHAMTGERERCLAAGCDEYLTKPITLAELTRAVRGYLKESSPTADSGTYASSQSATKSIASPPKVAVGEGKSNGPAQPHASGHQTQLGEPGPTLVSEFANDPDIGDLVESFVAGLPAQMRTINDALERGDRGMVVHFTHQLKGAAGGYGFPSITLAAGRLEQFAKTDGELSADLLVELNQLCASTQRSPAVQSLPPSRALLPRVLVIDDSPDIQALLAARLSSEQVVLRKAMSAREGLDFAFESPPDLVLLDLDLPDANGLGVCRELKTDPRTSNVPVLFLTGTEDATMKAAAFDLGAVDYITKPFEPTELRARVRSALRTKRYQDLLATRSQLDALTGLWNRGYFDTRLAEEASASLRHGHPLCVALLDIDHFKKLNDTFGHPFGDQVLQAFAAALPKTLRTSDVACRYGGEEFALILRETPAAQGLIVAERVRQAIANLPLKSRGEMVRITVSIGLACTDNASLAKLRTQPGTLVQAADTALYRAKNAGRNRVVQGAIS
jgi:diguanylate cyclase (GGDEF)-like protein/PAS domain S-box-containing protein